MPTPRVARFPMVLVPTLSFCAASVLAATSLTPTPVGGAVASPEPGSPRIVQATAQPSVAAPASQGSESRGLESLYDPGFLLEDRNGDGHLDYVGGCLSLPGTATDSEIAAAANIAARLGYETMSMDLPLPRVSDAADCGAAVLAIGADPAPSAGTSATELEPGTGAVTLLDGTNPIIRVTGGDTAGITAAALAVAARLPHLWDPEGDTLADVTTSVRAVLADGNVDPRRIIVRRIQVRHGAPDLDRVDLEVEVPSGSRETAVDLLRAAANRTDTAPGTEAAGGAAPRAGQEGAQAAGQEDAQAAAAETAEPLPHLKFTGIRLLRLQVTADSETAEVVWVSNDAGTPAGGGRRPGGGDKEDLDLSNLYSTDGFFSDTDGNLIPDRVDVVLSAADDRGGASIDLAARIGLEAAGVTIPLAITPEELEDPDRRPPLVLIGGGHPAVATLVEEERLTLPDLDPGQGWIGVVREAFNDRTALVLTGGDAAGLERAVQQLARTFPHLDERGKDRPTIEDVEDAMWRAVSSRSPVGQAATSLYKLETLAATLADRDLEHLAVSVHVEKADDGLLEHLRARADELFTADRIDVSVENIDVRDGKPIIDERIEIPSEVEAFWNHFRADVLPAVRPDTPVTLRALLSEPPEVRQRIADEARRELLAAGAAASTEVTVLSAYKQGYSWLYDSVRPRLEGVELGGIRIRFAEVGAPEGWPQQAMYTPTRWLLEIFPIDEVLARDLRLDLEQVAFEKMPKDAPAYEVIVTGTDGEQILRETFEPRWVLRDYFDRFPDYEKARVTTGWIEASVGDRTVVDERIITDLERFWDHFQGDTLMRIYDHVMLTSEGKPRASDAPHFGELRVDVTLSEPDYQIGVDKEQIASMEALHEEIYFGTLHFFDVLGRLARGQALNYPGRVIPVVRPKADGKAGSAQITFTGFDSPRPRVTVTYSERGELPQTLRRDLPPVSIDRPTPLEAFVREGVDGVEKLGFYVEVDFEEDRRDEFARRIALV